MARQLAGVDWLDGSTPGPDTIKSYVFERFMPGMNFRHTQEVVKAESSERNERN